MYQSEEIRNKSPGGISVKKVFLRGQKALEARQKINVGSGMRLL